jgi:hypothetical protein
MREELPIGGRRQTGDSLEHFAEVTLVRESGLQGDLEERSRGVREPTGRKLNADAAHKPARATVQMAAENGRKMHGWAPAARPSSASVGGSRNRAANISSARRSHDGALPTRLPAESRAARATSSSARPSTAKGETPSGSRSSAQSRDASQTGAPRRNSAGRSRTGECSRTCWSQCEPNSMWKHAPPVACQW